MCIVHVEIELALSLDMEDWDHIVWNLKMVVMVGFSFAQRIVKMLAEVQAGAECRLALTYVQKIATMPVELQEGDQYCLE